MNIAEKFFFRVIDSLAPRDERGYYNCKKRARRKKSLKKYMKRKNSNKIFFNTICWDVPLFFIFYYHYSTRVLFLRLFDLVLRRNSSLVQSAYHLRFFTVLKKTRTETNRVSMIANFFPISRKNYVNYTCAPFNNVKNIFIKKRLVKVFKRLFAN